MTDPRAALAEHLRIAAPSSARLGNDGALLTIDRLAERGVLLVTEERLAAAIESIGDPDLSDAEYAAAIFAALSPDHYKDSVMTATPDRGLHPDVETLAAIKITEATHKADSGPLPEPMGPNPSLTRAMLGPDSGQGYPQPPKHSKPEYDPLTGNPWTDSGQGEPE